MSEAPLDLEQFTACVSHSADSSEVFDDRTLRWLSATSDGFHETGASQVQELRNARMLAHNNVLMTEFAPTDSSPDPETADKPVATYAVFDGAVNLGASHMLPAAQITCVTVRPTHKRRGLLRAMMMLNLSQLAKRGVTMALLTASNASLYGRYGFQTVIRESELTVVPQATFALKVPLPGRVETVTIGWLVPHMQEIFDRYHAATRGSVTRYEGYYEDLYFEKTADTPDAKLSGAVHFGEDGVIDGYATYRAEVPASLKVIEVIAATPQAELALWRHLSAIELVKEIKYPHHPEDSPLPLALLDQRLARTELLSDALWARVFDPVAVLNARPYTLAARNSGLRTTLIVEDDLGFASGRYEVAMSPDGAHVGRVEDEASAVPTGVVARVSVQALSALAFGSETASSLSGAGLIDGADADALEVLDSIFAPVGRAGFMSFF